MKKPYITMSALILELLGVLQHLAALIYSIVAKDRVESGIIIFTVAMLFSSLLLVLILHFLPADMWNLAVKPKPEKKLIIFQTTAMLLAAMVFEMGAFTMGFTLLHPLGDKAMAAITIVFAVLMSLTILLGILMSILENK